MIKRLLILILISIALFGCNNSHAEDWAKYKVKGRYTRGGSNPRTYHYIFIPPEDICEVCFFSKKTHRKNCTCPWHPLEHMLDTK